MTIFTDHAAERLQTRTRYFRDAINGGVEWIFAVDHAAGHDRWYGFGPAGTRDIVALRAEGMHLARLP
jgi:hypothetical protein